MSPGRLNAARLAIHLGFVACLCAAFEAALWLRFSSGLWQVRDLPDHTAYSAFLIVAVAFWSLFARYFELDEMVLTATSFHAWAGRCARSVCSSAIAVAALAFYYRGYSYSRIAIVLFWLLQFGLVLAAGALLYRFRNRLAARVLPRAVVVIGSEPRVASLIPVGTLVRRVPISAAEQIRSLRTDAGCDEILVALAPEELGELGPMVEALRYASVPVRVALNVPGGTSVRHAGEFLLLNVGANPTDRLGYVIGKRTLDVVIAATALIAGAPLAILAAIAIRLSAGPPVLFRQERIGARGRRFTLYKFRTLPVEPAEISDRRWSATLPPEAASLGRLLRRTRVDEWPQFWNVLRGDMSVVGPRPERPHFAEGFGGALESYWLRQRLKPGITGLAQVRGLNGDTEIASRLECDLAYLHDWSLALDFKILLLTPLRALGWRRRPAPLVASTADISDHARPI